MQETASDVAHADDPGEEEMAFEMQLPPRGAQKAKFKLGTVVAPLYVPPWAAEASKQDYNVDFRQKQKEKSQVESVKQSKEIGNIQKFKSPPLTSTATPNPSV